MPEPTDFQDEQYKFAAYLRDPDNQPAPANIEPRRMAIYRDLFINNICNLLAGNFPVLAEIYGEQRWAMLVRDFYRDHKSKSPLFPDVPKEFLQYLADERPAGKRTDNEPDPPFLYELAHYEWVESGLLLAKDTPPDPRINPAGDVRNEIPVLSDVAWLLSYNYPVNQIGKEHQPQEPAEQPLYFIVYRNIEDKVNFIKMNIVSARLFEILNENRSLTGLAALELVAEELQHPQPDKVIASGANMLAQWAEKNIIIGTFSST
jgi:hypothetical protein